MDLRMQRFAILYPETGTRTGAQLIQHAKDHLATVYMATVDSADEAAIEENARVRSVGEAMDILSDAGLYTFTRDARAQAGGE